MKDDMPLNKKLNQTKISYYYYYYYSKQKKKDEKKSKTICKHISILLLKYPLNFNFCFRMHIEIQDERKTSKKMNING